MRRIRRLRVFFSYEGEILCKEDFRFFIDAIDKESIVSSDAGKVKIRVKLARKVVGIYRQRFHFPQENLVPSVDAMVRAHVC